MFDTVSAVMSQMDMSHESHARQIIHQRSIDSPAILFAANQLTSLASAAHIDNQSIDDNKYMMMMLPGSIGELSHTTLQYVHWSL
jgi:hypothetical protein